MPATQYINFEESNFSYGIDARSAENQIAQGFVRDLLNGDVIENRARSRTGYQGYAGNIPVRVTGLEYQAATHQMLLSFDSAISLDAIDVDLSSTLSSPLVIYGRSGSISSGGPFLSTGDSVHYYSGFSVPQRKVFGSGSGTISVPETEHGIPTTDLFAQVVESTSPTDRSYTSAIPNTIQVNESSADLLVSYTNDTGGDLDVFCFYKNETPVVGQSFLATISHTGGGAQTFTYTVGTHALSNFNILASLQQETSPTRTFVEPDLLTVSSTGTVQVTINSNAAATFYLLLEAAPISNRTTGNISGMSSGEVQVPLTSPWAFFGIYLQTSPGGDLEQVIPDSVDYDDPSGTATVSFTNENASAAGFVVLWDYGRMRSNQLAVTDSSVTVDGLDDSPQLTVWGLDHTEIYAQDASTRSGWATFLDSYRSPGEQRLLTGLGGNLFASETLEEVGTEYAFPVLYPNLQARTGSATVVGPAFYATGASPGRTRGWISLDGGGTGWAAISACAWNPATGWVDLTLELPNGAAFSSSGTPTTYSSVLSSESGLEDWLTVQQMSFQRHQGTFRIRQVSGAGNQAVLSVENLQVTSSDYDDSGCSGLGGVFTDQVTWDASPSPFIPGDLVTSAALPDQVICMASLGAISVLGGFSSDVGVASGIVTVGTRVSQVLPLRSGQPAAAPSSLNLVRGDMLSYVTQDPGWDGRLLRVLEVRGDSDLTGTVSSDGETATVTLTGTPTGLSVGSSVLLLGSRFAGTQVVTSVDGTEIQFIPQDTTEVASEALTLVGHVALLDESFGWQDTTDDSSGFQAPARWIPVEAPDDSYSLTPSTHTFYLDSESYGSQPFLRSTGIQSSLYMTNGLDEVLKYDGENVYRAGLFAWQPGLFLTQDTSVPGKVVIDVRSISYTAISVAGGYLTIDPADEAVLPVGTQVLVSGDPDSYVIQSVADDPSDVTKAYVYLDRSLSGTVTATGTLTEIATYNYYFRLNAIDANGNIVASAATGSQDYGVEMSENAAIYLKLLGLPAWDVYDYSRLEVEIYRTKQSTPAPFYLITTLQMLFNSSGDGYLDYTDTFADVDLLELDDTMSALKGQELGTAWQEPLRAGCVTSINNQLVLGNIKDYPQLDIQFLASADVDNSAYAGKVLTFSRDATNLGSGTDMVSCVRFQFVGTSTGTSTGITPGSGTFSVALPSLPSGLVPGAWIYLSYSSIATSARDLTYCGWWQVAGVSGSTVTVNLVGAAAAGSYPDSYTCAANPLDVPVLLDPEDGNLGMTGAGSFPLFEAFRRLSLALNSVMRVTDTTISGYSAFTPWMVARGGNDTGTSGRIIVRQPRADSTSMAVTLPSSFTGGGFSFQAFVQDVRVQPSQSVAAVTRLFPSRILASYPNYPEIFDNPTSQLDTQSDSAIDVNPSDGQELVAIIPFFGDATFTASQQASVLVALKTNSVYLVDLNQKRLGNDCVQRIETEGIGCTARNSVAVTKNGIMFANESGMYCLRRNLTVEYLGRFMERNWEGVIGLEEDQLELMQGHHWGTGRMYKLSVPLADGTAASQVYVYNHTGEDVAVPIGQIARGAWSRYDNHPSTGWCNLAPDAYFSGTSGRVFSLRRAGTVTDSRDDAGPIDFLLDTRALDFGAAGIRKVIDNVVAHYRTVAESTEADLSYSINLTKEFTGTQAISLEEPVDLSGIDDFPGQDIVSIRHSVQKRRGVYLSVRIENTQLDQPIEVAGLSIRVGGLTSQGVTQAAQVSK